MQALQRTRSSLSSLCISTHGWCALVVSCLALAGAPAAGAAEVRKLEGKPFGATPLDLAARGYVEEEYLVTGNAARYRNAGPLATAQKLDGEYPYATRIVVRRPARAHDFNGTVLVEWYNVSLGQDIDFTFAGMHEHLIRSGYAYVAVSAQQGGIEGLRRADPARYEALSLKAPNEDPAGGAPLDGSGDVLSWDVYGDVARLLRREPAGILGALKPRLIIGVGESQGAFRLSHYYNAIHPLHRAYDGFLTYDRAGPMRDDLGTKTISVGTEAFGNPPPPDGANHRWYEVAGASHVSLQEIAYLDPIVQRDGALRDAAAKAQSLTGFVLAQGCTRTPPFSRVPTGHVLNSSLERLVAWVRDGRVPPAVPRLGRRADGTPERTQDGRVSGGVVLPAYSQPLAANGSDNSPAGVCALSGYHEDYAPAALCQRYGTHRAWRQAVHVDARRMKRQGWLLEADVAATLREADAAKSLFAGCAGKP